MRTKTFKPCLVSHMYRTYAPTENGPTTRIGRTYKTLKACLKVAATLSRQYPYIEITDDHLPMNKRLLAIARKGMVITDVHQVDIGEALA